MKTVLDFLGQLWLRFLKPDGSITVPHPNEGKAKQQLYPSKESGDFPPRTDRIPLQLVERGD